MLAGITFPPARIRYTSTCTVACSIHHSLTMREFPSQLLLIPPVHPRLSQSSPSREVLLVSYNEDYLPETVRWFHGGHYGRLKSSNCEIDKNFYGKQRNFCKRYRLALTKIVNKTVENSKIWKQSCLEERVWKKYNRYYRIDTIDEKSWMNHHNNVISHQWSVPHRCTTGRNANLLKYE